MDEMSRLGARLLARTVVVWTGWHRATWPQRDETAVVELLGEDLAAEVMPVVRRLEEEFFESDARFVASDLQEMGELAAARFRSLHAELPEELVQALAWSYVFTYK